ncbi:MULTISPECIES: hypothetical protein [Gordonia]|jgi:hypothetical protein|uniref:Uncharacterized protein n=2 Tax=Gordonia alkanivorans TaxID=84096 RepID=F9VRV3_9ACTN|nr:MULTISPECIES: hypothetical protein [Gordonia]AZZ81390.1 hypothetical protein C5O27_10190 [Gordonia alkanivorans]ETA07228.1 hypothetical protein V525_07675 [Gordonia alkanivorans CGMCC 6845]MDH3009284.1 hypothetical protein [Gordonia alkanivorans]MDH3010600.1 hypothetical protein [Gordonia alkanivorans]MDH3018180.1 hypothetical protein [Gordonia alkanivorans]
MAGSQENQSDQSGSGGQDDGRRRRSFRWDQHIGRTSIRISTAILLVVFILCCVLYGYTSQRYGIVSPEPPRPAPRTSQVVEEPTYEEPLPSTTYEESTSKTPSGSTTGEPGVEGGTDAPLPPGETRSPSQQSAPRNTIPGLPGVEIPNFGAPTPTTPVPTR